MRILTPPNAITDLQASPVGINNGDVQLVWTAPANVNGATITGYVVRVTTFPAVSPPLAETWWSLLPSSERRINSAHAPGVTEFSTISGLTVGVTQYFGIKAVDSDGQLSPIDLRVGTLQQAASLPLSLGGPPPTPGSLTGVAQSTGSILWQWSTSAGAGFYTLNASPSGTLIVQTSLLQFAEGGFTPNMPISRTVRAGNGNGLSSPTPSQTAYTLAAAPTSPALVQLAVDGVTIGWNANGNPAGTLYRVERSPDNTNFTPLSPLVTATSFADSGLQTLTSYYYRISAVNGDGIRSAVSPTLTIFTPTDIMPPRAPLGLKGVVTAPNFLLTWEPVTRNADGTPLTDLAGYYVYRASSPTGGRTRVTPAALTTPVFADQPNGTFYYVVHAVDTHGNESEDSFTADSSDDANIIFLARDGFSSVRMPKDINDVLQSGHNKYGVPLSLTLIEEPILSDTTVIRDIRLQLVRGDTLAPVDDVAFPAAHATVSVGFSLIAGDIARGAPGQASVRAQGVTPNQLGLYWNNGVSWIRLGGVLDLPNQTVNIRTAFLGNYELRSAPGTGSLHLDKANVYPRIITPNGDGLNDRVYFVLDNPNNAGVRGEILDKDGRHVATLPDPAAVSGIGTTLIWDGKDGNGNVVPGGAYIYRIQGEGQTFTGTVGVAR